MSVTLPRSTPSEQGINPRGLDAFLDAMDAASDIELHSLMVLRHGHVVAEGWWSPYAPDRVHLLYSLSKSFTSTAAGFAVAEGLLDLDAPVISYFPELDAEITDPGSRSMRVRHIAAMASGHLAETLDEAIGGDPLEPVRGFLLIPPDAEPGTVFAYNQPCTYTLAAIIQRLSGQSLTDYLRPRLFEPLGIEEYGWLQHPPGRDIGFSGFHATTEAIAKLGLLYLQRGVWDGRQLLSERWVAEATRRHVDNPDQPEPDWRQGYGFQFWMARHGYRGDGAYGQFCVVLPEHDTVIATTADTLNMQAILDALWTHVLPAIGESVQPSAADDQLRDRLATAELPALAAEPSPADPDRWSRRFSRAGDPVAQQPTLEAVELAPSAGTWSVELQDAGRTITCPFGSGVWQIGSGEVPVAASGGWIEPDRFRVDVIFLETPHRLLIECAGDTFTATWRTEPLHSGPLHQLRLPVPGVAVAV